jgi:hypothetical protein
MIILRVMQKNKSVVFHIFLSCNKTVQVFLAFTLHVQPAQWERLKQYWGTEKQVLKSAKMVEARSKVKHVSVVGRKGKAGQEAVAVSSFML